MRCKALSPERINGKKEINAGNRIQGAKLLGANYYIHQREMLTWLEDLLGLYLMVKFTVVMMKNLMKQSY